MRWAWFASQNAMVGSFGAGSSDLRLVHSSQVMLTKLYPCAPGDLTLRVTVPSSNRSMKTVPSSGVSSSIRPLQFMVHSPLTQSSQGFLTLPKKLVNISRPVLVEQQDASTPFAAGDYCFAPTMWPSGYEIGPTFFANTGLHSDTRGLDGTPLAEIRMPLRGHIGFSQVFSDVGGQMQPGG